MEQPPQGFVFFMRYQRLVGGGDRRETIVPQTIEFASLSVGLVAVAP
jgi:hypothetical protein